MIAAWSVVIAVGGFWLLESAGLATQYRPALTPASLDHRPGSTHKNRPGLTRHVTQPSGPTAQPGRFLPLHPTQCRQLLASPPPRSHPRRPHQIRQEPRHLRQCPRPIHRDSPPSAGTALPPITRPSATPQCPTPPGSFSTK